MASGFLLAPIVPLGANVNNALKWQANSSEFPLAILDCGQLLGSTGQHWSALLRAVTAGRR